MKRRTNRDRAERAKEFRASIGGMGINDTPKVIGILIKEGQYPFTKVDEGVEGEMENGRKFHVHRVMEGWV